MGLGLRGQDLLAQTGCDGGLVDQMEGCHGECPGGGDESRGNDQLGLVAEAGVGCFSGREVAS